MSRTTVPIALILGLIAVLTAITAPDLFGLMTSLEAETSGTSTAISAAAGRAPLILFVFIGVVFTTLFAVGARR